MSPPNELQALLQQAALHERQGRLPEAVALYERLLKQWPALPNTWYNLALLQRRLGRFEQALASYQQALNRNVEQPEEVHLNRSVIYSDGLHQPDAAERELQAALTLNPHYVPALLNLGNLHEDLGRRDAALASYERLLAIDPGCHEALARYAKLRGASSPDDPLLDRLRKAMAAPTTPSIDKASLGFALGQLLDGCQAYDAAFEAYRAANAHSRACIKAPGPLYDRTRHTQLIDQIIQCFPAPSTAAVAPGATPPLFICGMFRSGSTLAEQVLAGHSQVVAGGEISFIPELVRTRLAPYPAGFSRLAPQELAAIATQYRQTLATLAPGASHVTDKRPDNFLHIGLVKTLFPNAKIVHTTRSPLDNALSVYFLHIDQSMGYALDLSDIGHYYREYRRLMAHWKSLYGADILDFDYDALVKEPEPAVQRLLGFCGLGWEEGCMRFDRVSNAVRTASVWQVRQPLYRHASGRWRHYEQHLGPLREVLGEIAKESTDTGP